MKNSLNLLFLLLLYALTSCIVAHLALFYYSVYSNLYAGKDVLSYAFMLNDHSLMDSRLSYISIALKAYFALSFIISLLFFFLDKFKNSRMFVMLYAVGGNILLVFSLIYLHFAVMSLIGDTQSELYFFCILCFYIVISIMAFNDIERLKSKNSSVGEIDEFSIFKICNLYFAGFTSVFFMTILILL